MIVKALGGNQYEVTIPKEDEKFQYVESKYIDEMGEYATKVVDLDGCTCISDEDEERLHSLGLYDETMFSPKDWSIDNDPFFFFAVSYVVRQSAFDMEQYIINHL
jgi:hypothetical protein